MTSAELSTVNLEAVSSLADEGQVMLDGLNSIIAQLKDWNLRGDAIYEQLVEEGLVNGIDPTRKSPAAVRKLAKLWVALPAVGELEGIVQE